MKTRNLDPDTRTPLTKPDEHRPARHRERPGFRPDMQRLEPRISLSGLVHGIVVPPPGAEINHNETLLRGRSSRPAGR